MNGVDLIAAERQRQVEAEGWTPEHDDTHDREELTLAALTYLTRSPWPWDDGKPRLGPRRTIDDLVKAGALIAAEIDRRQRVPDERNSE